MCWKTPIIIRFLDFNFRLKLGAANPVLYSDQSLTLSINPCNVRWAASRDEGCWAAIEGVGGWTATGDNGCWSAIEGEG